jgi:sugar phosphate isomerase/epimerase
VVALPVLAKVVLAACEWIFEPQRLEQTVPQLAETGYDAIEVVGDPGRQDLAQLQALLETHRMRAIGTTPQPGPVAERDLAQPDREERRRAVAYYQGCAQLAARLGARSIGLVPSAEGRLQAVASFANEWASAVEAAREVAYFAGEHGVAVAVEPLNRYEACLVNRIDQAIAFVREVALPNVGIVADLFHMNIEERDVESALREAAPLLLELHLADSNRRGLGHGHLPVRRLVSLAQEEGFPGPYVMEFTAPSSVELGQYLRESALFVQNPRSPS